MIIKALYRKPSGFSDVDLEPEGVDILGFVWGKSQDNGKYNNNRE